MQRIAWLALTALLLWGTPAFAGPGGSDVDGDGILDDFDNCSIKANPAQDDTDGDDCGNVCDSDFNQDGRVTFADFGIFTICFGELNCALVQCVEPISANNVLNFADFGCFVAHFGGTPGPSGTTPGTVACP
jgi:hypothetical protein